MPELKRRTTTVVIYQGDDLERLGELRREAEIARRAQGEAAKSGAARMGDDSDAAAAEAAYDEFVDEAAERAIEVRLEAVGRAVFRNLMAEHPPREGNDEDAMFAVNVATFPDALLPLSVKEPRFDSDVERLRFLEDLSDGDFDRMFSSAYWLNRAPGSDPKESRFSAAPRTSTETSN